MDYFREMLNMGSNIRDTVNDAIDRNDYSGLAKNITDQMAQFAKMTANDVNGKRYYTTTQRGGYRPQDIDLGTRQNRPSGATSNQQQRQTAYRGQTYTSNARNAQSQNQNAQSAAGKFTGAKTGAGYNAGQAYDARRQERNQSWNYSASGATGTTSSQQRQQTSKSTAITPFNQYRPKASGGWLKQGAGIFGLAVTVPAAVALVVTASVLATPAAIAGAAVMGAGVGLSGYVTSQGSKQRKLASTFDKYSRAVGAGEYASIEDIAIRTSETPEMVTKNIDDMIAAGMLPQAKYDAGKTTVMFTKNAYDQYLLAENARMDREKEEAELDAKMGSADARKIISEGEAFVVKIRKANDMIPGHEMTDKLDQMERIVSKIFAQVRKEPSSAADLRKFMNYYLPTTEKLLNAYIDLDKQPEVGENITKTKREIEQTVDTINDAFENLLDSLFQDVAWDISSDISVMKTMMEQDGLMKKNMAEATAAADVVSDPIPDVAPAVDFTTPKPAPEVYEEVAQTEGEPEKYEPKLVFEEDNKSE